MKSAVSILLLVTLGSGLASAKIICEGSKVMAQVVASEKGLLLVGNKKGQEAGVSFVGVITEEGMVFDGEGHALKNLKAVFAEDSFKRYESGLDISTGSFYIQKYGTSKILLSDENMKCETSPGE